MPPPTDDPVAPGLRASVVVVGDELLGGYVRDTNSWFLIGELRRCGVPLDRLVMVGDDPDDIADALRGEIVRGGPRVVVTSGGVGPTPDDITVAVVADVLGRPLVAHPEAVANVEEALAWTADQGVEVPADQAAGLRRLADLPADAYLLAARPGTTPAVVCDVDAGSRAGGTTVVVLPGVPAELERLVREGVSPELLEGRGRQVHAVELRHGYPESFLGPELDRLVLEEPDVQVGSYPDRECVVRLRGPVEAVERAASRLRTRLAQIDAEPGSEQVRRRWAERWSTGEGLTPADVPAGGTT